MKKLSILSVATIAVVFTLVTVYSESDAQSITEPKKVVDQFNRNFIKWFNSGDIDSIVKMYGDSACLEGRGCGKEFIKKYYESESALYKFEELVSTDITVKGNVAIESGRFKLNLKTGMALSGNYQSEWQFVDNKWIIVKDMLIMIED